jgi:hypothetical protein
MTPTANEIRELKYDLQGTRYPEYVTATAVIEVAAQLAELNQFLKKEYLAGLLSLLGRKNDRENRDV